MKVSIKPLELTLTTIAMLWLAVAVPTEDAVAQQTKRIFFTTPAANSKYIQQHTMDIKDEPGHQIRIFEVHRTFTNEPPVINGIKLVEIYVRGLSDYIDMKGPNTNYAEFVMENGDKFFSRVATEAQDLAKLNGSRNYVNSLGTITGGTGLFKGIRGTVRTEFVFDLKAGQNEGRTEIEYFIVR